MNAAAVISARLLDKLDGSQADTLSIRMDRSVHVIWDLERSLRNFFFVVVYVFTTTFDPTNTVGSCIYTQIHSSRVPQMCFFIINYILCCAH